MALLFQVRGTQLDAYVTQSFKAWARDSANGQVPSVVADASAGVFGSSKLDVRALIGPNALQYVGLDNLPYGTGAAAGAFTMLIRIIPTYTGNPPSTQTYVMVGPSAGATANQGLYVRHSTAGMLSAAMRSTNQTSRFDVACTVALTGLVSGVPTDIWLTWDGTGNAGSVKFYYAHNGNVPVLLQALNPNGAMDERQRYAANPIVIGAGVFGSSNYYLNEFCFWSGVEDPTSYGARTNFITATAFEGMNTDDVSASQLVAGVTKTIKGVSVTGSAVTAAKATTKVGVTANDGVGEYYAAERWTDLNPALVARGEGYKANSETNNRTGILDTVTNTLSAQRIVAHPGGRIIMRNS